MALLLSSRACARGSRVSLAVLSALGMVEAGAQTTPGQTLEEVTVSATGTNISGIAPVGSEALSIDREEMLSIGANDIADVVRKLPQIQNLGFDETSRGGNSTTDTGGNATRGNSINLRGIGQNATLVLVDGHRLAPAGTQTSFYEAIQVPIAAVERVEVIADGASAIYGSDAVSGVVNFVLRKDFEGMEVTGRYNVHQYSSDWAASMLGGTHWQLGSLGRGNVIASYEHVQQEPLRRGELRWFRQDLRSLGGPDNRVMPGSVTPGNAGNISVSTTPLAPLFMPPNPPGPVNPAFADAGTNTLYGLPSGNGQGLTYSQLRANQPNLLDRADFEDYLSDTERKHVTLFINQELAPGLSGYYQGFYVKRDTFTHTFYSQQASGAPTVTVPANLVTADGRSVPNPNYIHGIPNTVQPPGPFGAGGPQPLTVQYNFRAHMPPGYQVGNDTWDETFSHTLGFRAELAGGWNADWYYTYGTVENCGVCYLNSFVNADSGNALQRAVNEGFINPLSSEPLTEAQWNRIRGSNIQTAQNRLNDTVLKFDGPLFDVPAGAVKMAVGAQYTELNNKVQNGAQRSPTFIGQTPAFGSPDIFVWDAGSDTTRYQNAGFVELFVPAVAPAQEVPVVRSLNFSAAVRYDDYSDFGSTTNPKLGFTWELVHGFSLRGSWGTSFRAPNIPETDNGVFSVTAPLPGFIVTNNSGDPTLLPAGSNVLLRIGGNPQLQPEEGETWSFGFDWSPEFLSGLRVAGTYYRVEYDSRIVSPPALQFLANPRNRQTYDAFITPIPQVAGCNRDDRSTWHPAVRDAYENPPINHLQRGFLYGIENWSNPNIDICNIRLILDGRNINAAGTLQDGVDLQLGYSFGALGSFWNLGLVGSKILTNEQTFIAGAPTEDILDRINFPVDLRARASLTWGWAGWNASLFGNYVDGYRNDIPPNVGGVPQAQSDVPSWITWDISLGYSMPEGASTLLDGVRAIVNVQNVFDRDPPTVLIASAGGAVAMDARNHNPFGRIFQFSLTKRF